ncbi:dnaJ homolog subfamily C member 17 [Chelonus insularis]|uniref:dnaJ homolog subfamily C member 17 n=1 Tax=Chelonus insularis TaxID=460826 RepID=UPI00158E57BA|nr:dnaJ homolog subfamily C member 17 [Chelonus insularis]
MDDDIMMNLDLYELIGTVSTASVKEIETAYRKKALSCHPDKNPDNPRAADLFRELKRALEILTDESSRAAYDKVLNGRLQAKVRKAQLDSKRRKLIEDLEAREAASTKCSDEQKLEAEIKKLKREGARLVEEEAEIAREKFKKIYEQINKNQSQRSGPNDTMVHIKWKAAKDDLENGGYNYDNLYRILSKHGPIEDLVMSKKKGRAMVNYRNVSDAISACKIERGLYKNPLTLQSLRQNDSTKTFPSSSSVPKVYTNKLEEMENLVFSNIKKEEERRKLADQQMKNSSANGSYSSQCSTKNLFPSANSQNKAEKSFPSFSSAPNMNASQFTNVGSRFSNDLKREEERRKLIEQMIKEDNEDELKQEKS